jgi:uncharacterized membrane protein YhaH (DUF805 family)
MNYYFEVLKKYAVFNGRARRKEYWMFFLFTIIITYALYFLDVIIFGSKGMHLFYSIYCLATFIPGIAVTFRRLHDTNHSAWWYFILLIPIIGAIWFIILLAKDSDAGDNKYGANPKQTKVG